MNQEGNWIYFFWIYEQSCFQITYVFPPLLFCLSGDDNYLFIVFLAEFFFNLDNNSLMHSFWVQNTPNLYLTQYTSLVEKSEFQSF